MSHILTSNNAHVLAEVLRITRPFTLPPRSGSAPPPPPTVSCFLLYLLRSLLFLLFFLLLNDVVDSFIDEVAFPFDVLDEDVECTCGKCG